MNTETALTAAVGAMAFAMEALLFASVSCVYVGATAASDDVPPVSTSARSTAVVVTAASACVFEMA